MILSICGGLLRFYPRMLANLTLVSGEINLKERLKIAEEYGCRCVIETKTIEC